MNNDNEISFDKIVEIFETNKNIDKDKKVVEHIENNKERFIKIEHLCKEDYIVYKEKMIGKYMLYMVINKESDRWMWIQEEKVLPTSIREKLHNIQENKEFYESTRNNR